MVTTMIGQEAEVAMERRHYPNEYQHPRSILTQIVDLKRFLPQVRQPKAPFIKQALRNEKHPGEGHEGHFLVPHWSAVANEYNRAVAYVFDMLREVFGLDDLTHGRISREYLRETEQKARIFGMLKAEQGSDSVIITGHFGLLFRDYSPGMVRESAEICPGIFETGVMLLLHPERLTSEEDLGIDAAGDMWRPTERGDYWFAPSYSHNGKNIEFLCGRIDNLSPEFGAPTGIPLH